MKLQQPSSGAPEPDDAVEARWAELARIVTEEELFGAVWCGPDLVVQSRFGALVDFVAPGRVVTDAVIPLLGLDAQILALREQPGSALDIRNVSIVTDAGQSPRLNLHVTWQAPSGRFLLIVGRVMSTSEIEIELTRQTRARLIAEALLVEKSREIERANVELTRANRDLNEFAHIISHDLKAPLRAMRYIADDIEAALSDPDLRDPAVHVGHLRAQSRRMSNMLSDLLTYSRIGRSDAAAEPVDVAGLLNTIVGSLDRPPGFSIAVSGDRPVVMTQPAPLDLVLRNLIDNAVRHHDRPDGEVRIAVARSAHAVTVEISDDGPGIAPAHHETIFQPFRRLAADGADGSGIGLSLVRRTIETHGGRLELHSDPELRPGTTFRVHWPVADARAVP